MITLYGFPRSRSLRISWLLEELNLEWRYSLVDFNQGEHRSPEFLSINPAGKVPALVDGELVLLESGAISLHLAQRYGPHWLPEPGSDEAARHNQLLFFSLCELEQPLWTMGKHRFALPEERRVPAVLETAAWEFSRAASLMDRWVPERGYLLGEQPRVADILLTHTLNWAHGFKQPLPDKLDSYRLRVSQRPALARAMQRETEALPSNK
ncbi:glutathione S-transferase [Ferrimonas sediminicola]|uniref:Glutathione S-transferase n=1 Tax=Ferrimonas sediminicola TaxID=2569538 RepID=A0A4U1BDA0_9GAMM|nr:glutathione S-transferase [Ferrimonas sediminicola]TKB48729.1 glutathione S-transferase [Ferrimonas sediminicola]